MIHCLCEWCVFSDMMCLCAAAAVSVCLLYAWKGILGHGVYFLQPMRRIVFRDVCSMFIFILMYYIFIIYSPSLSVPMCMCICSSRCGVISRLFSPLSTAAPPTWWWPCGSLCPSGRIRLNNDAPLQVFLGHILTYILPVTREASPSSPCICCSQKELARADHSSTMLLFFVGLTCSSHCGCSEDVLHYLLHMSGS